MVETGICNVRGSLTFFYRVVRQVNERTMGKGVKLRDENEGWLVDLKFSVLNAKEGHCSVFMGREMGGIEMNEEEQRRTQICSLRCRSY